MTQGVLRIDWSESKPEAAISPDGWRSDDTRLLSVLDSHYKPPATEAGTPWVIAFWQAVHGLDAVAVQEPEADPYVMTGAANGQQ